MPDSLTLREIKARPVVLKLKRPVVARIATLSEWPLVLVDLVTEEGIVGRSYLEPYIVKSLQYLVPALLDLGELLRGRSVAPVELFAAARKSLHFVGYEGLSLIAASGLDMAAWDALAKAANKPLCVLLGATVGAVRSYNSNGLWLKEPAAVAAEALELRDEGGFSALKLRQDCHRRPALRSSRGHNHRSHGTARWLRRDLAPGCSPLSNACDRRLLFERRQESPDPRAVHFCRGGHAQLAAELKTPIQIGENFYGPREMHKAIAQKACDLVMPDFMRIGGVTGWMRAAAIAGAAGIPISTHLYPEVAAHVMRATETAHWLEWQDWADPILERPYEIKDGFLHIPDTPGVGLEWNEAAVAAHLASV
ncbi:mandelate racemase [Bradyrhizobium elkanii]|nr:enolase C-terminal domain-like protein [Bradyrhizobium elkanii]WLA83860.1 enolase C-terminal domain-like protein [Bradyrhizobium elkanii]